MLNTTLNTIIRRSALALLVAAPMVAMAADDNRPERPKGPPAEAIEACASLSEGDACSATTRRGDMEGTCKAAPSGEEGPLACAPEGGPGGKGGRPPRNDS